MNLEIETIEASIFAGTVADEIVTLLADTIDASGQATFVLAGGSTPAAVYRSLVLPPRVDQVDWSKVTCFIGDERWVPPDHQQSNYHMAQATFLSGFGTRAPACIAVDTTLRNAGAGADDYGKRIAQHLKLKAGELPKFDLVLLGMGGDGHTASLFPHSKLITDWSGIAAPCIHPGDGSERVTLLPGAIFSAAQVIFIVTGADKAETVAKVVALEGDENELPARLCHKAKGHVTWFLDSPAAASLN